MECIRFTVRTMELPLDLVQLSIQAWSCAFIESSQELIDWASDSGIVWVWLDEAMHFTIGGRGAA